MLQSERANQDVVAGPGKTPIMNDAHFAQHDYLIRETVMSLHAAAAGTQEHAQNYPGSTNPYTHPFAQQPQLSFYPPTSASAHHLGQSAYGGSHLYGNTGNHHSNLPQNLSSNHKDQSSNREGLKEPQIPQQQVQMPPTQEYDVNSCYNDKYVGDQLAGLKETQKSFPSLSPTSQDNFSHHFKKEHLNSKTSQYLTQENFDAHRKLHLDQTDRSQDLRHSQSAVEAENLSKPSINDKSEDQVPDSYIMTHSGKNQNESNQNSPKESLFISPSDRQTDLEQISPIPSSTNQHSDHLLPRQPLEEPMVDGEKVSPIASDRTNPVGLHREQIPEPPFGDLSPTTPISNPKQSQNVSPSPTNQRHLEVTSTPIPPGRDAGNSDDTEPSALDKLKSLASRTDDLVLKTSKPLGEGQGQIGEGESKSQEASDRKALDRRQSYQSSEYSSDSEDRYDEGTGSYDDLRRSLSSEENFQIARERNPGFPFPPFALAGLGGFPPGLDRRHPMFSMASDLRTSNMTSPVTTPAKIAGPRDIRSSSSSSDLRPPSTSSSISDLRPPSSNPRSPGVAPHMRPLSLDMRSTPVDMRAQSGMHSPATQEILRGTTTTGADGKEIFFCHLCSYVGNSRFHFNSHMNSHFEHSCPHCDYTSRTEGRLKRHIKDFHSDNPPDNFSGNKTMRSQPSRPKTFKCKQCDFSTQDKIESWTHARIHIKEDKILQCPKCPFVTEYKHHLEYHLRNHFGSKPFKCPKCNYACVNKSMLNSHMKSHTNVYQYRCADCTYATKYCHSLKLHLKKYSHKPATVLNLDGSLPMDGSGDFELVSKRGPPRGPRGPRKDQMPGTPPVTLPHMGGLGSPPRSISNGVASGQMNGILPNMHPNMAAANMAVAAGFWPMMTGLNGIHGPPPLIPVNPLHPLNIQVPSSEQRLVANNVVNGVRTSPNEDSNPDERAPVGSKEDARPSAPESGMSIQETQMNAQLQHMMKMHENHQDLFRMFGIRPESLMEEQLNAWKILAERERELMMKLARDESNAKPDQKEVSKTVSPVAPGTVPQGETPVKVNPKVAENAGNQAWIMDAMTANQQTSLSPHPTKEHYNKVVAADLAAQIEAEAQTNGECPLDLTKASSNEDDSGIVHSTDGALDYSPNVMQRKRPLDSDGSNGSQPGSRSASPTPKKRKRKGKAYKLDTLCMKLQERYTDSPPPGEDTNQDYYSDYMPERDTKSGLLSETAKSDRDSENSENSDDGFDRTKEFQHSLSSGRLSPNENDLTNQSEALEKSSNQENEDPDKKQEANGEKPNDDFSCPHCDIMFKNCVMYNLHMGYHGYHDPFKCNKCGHISKDSVEFYLHIGQVAH